ncbi:Holliday junction branch migration protein RuvA [Pseudolysinimonas sp.]|uniref:Holliday junction branch migration protein RuvA n=1 Tax=Pseudolysinimonas sp. TaxID=2680009 RepID=UPI00286B8F99|nr:Holliday junction branch migration protein RuvA [Pseudolysinimonas sp.]
MISSVRGTVLSVTTSHAQMDVGGLGYSVQITPQHALTLRVGSEARLHTALIVREDDMSLFGFATSAELEMFDLLRGVSGVGPKSALGVLATLTPDQIASAVATEDDAPFRKVSGIGPKTAKLIVVSLAGKIVAPVGIPSAPAPASSTVQNVVAALVGLGWNERVAGQAVDEVIETSTEDGALPVPALLRLALARLGPQQVRS